MTDPLLPLLRRIRDGLASSDELDRARTLLGDDPRVDDELRAVALTDDDDLPGDAAGLLAVLGADDLGPLIAEAIAAEAGRTVPTGPVESDIDAATLDALPWTYGPSLAAAVRDEAGSVDVVTPVLEACNLHDGVAPAIVRRAVRHEAGLVDVVDEVLAACGLSDRELPVADAVRGEAGDIDIAADVIPWSQVDVAGAVRAAAGSIDVSAAVMARLVERPHVAPNPVPSLEPANDTRAFAFVGVLLAAAVALFVSLSGIELGPSNELKPLAFAHADEVVVEDLTSDTDVLMLQGEGQDGAFILWVDEET